MIRLTRLAVLSVGLGGIVIAALAAGCAPVAQPAVPTNLPPVTRVVFVGDSLVHRSARDHGMLDAVRDELVRRHPGLALEVVDAGVNGDRIADIRGRLDRDVLALRPSAVVLYWDSDVSDVDERGMKPDEVSRVRAAYEANLRDVLERLTTSEIPVMMSGPTLIGERPRGLNEKDAQLDAYRALNRRVARLFRVVYVDTRRAFLNRRPPGAPPDADRGVLTEDGEHLNERGAIVAREQFVRALDRWMPPLPRAERCP